MTLVSFKNVSKVYNAHSVALDDITFEIQAKEFVSIVGKSGAGKSTLLKLLIAEESPTAGRIFFDNHDIHKLKPQELPVLRRRIGAVFQDYKLLPQKTAYENVAYAMEVAGRPENEIKRDVPQVLDLVGLTEKGGNFPHQLSGGEKQRVAIARALVQRPDVIVADEPTGNLDPMNTWEIIKLLLKINEFGTTVILASHNKEIVDSLDRRVIILEQGKLVRDEEKGKFIMT